MHVLLTLSSVLAVVLVGYLALGVGRRLRDWRCRRDLQLLVLASPVVSVALGLGMLQHFAGEVCFLGAPPWDYTLSAALPFGMGLMGLGALGLGVLRHVLVYCLVVRRGLPAGPELQALTDRLADQLGAPRTHLRLCVAARPVALTWGLSRPTLLLSCWLVEHLDRQELEAVLAHELAHVARRDYAVVWLATVLRDAFCYLPTSWVAHRQLQEEKELACDEAAVGLTHRPLALASALAKVWQQALAWPPLGAAQPLAEASAAIERRIERLLTPPEPRATEHRSRTGTLGIAAAGFAALLAVEATSIALAFVPMGCGPASLAGRLL